MVRVKVDYNDFEEISKSIDSYIEKQIKKTHDIKNEVQLLGQNWRGLDYVALLKVIENLEEDSSVTKTLEKSLKSYANLLRSTASEYKKAQETAINLANKL